MTVMTLNLVEKQPAAMRRIIGKHLAVPRWQDTCDYYNQMPVVRLIRQPRVVFPASQSLKQKTNITGERHEYSY